MNIWAKGQREAGMRSKGTKKAKGKVKKEIMIAGNFAEDFVTQFISRPSFISK